MQSRPRKRHYHDGCAVAQVMDVIGERWALLIMREMMFGPKRFGDLRTALPGISANVLTQRLEGLEEVGIVARRKLPSPISVQVYELTPWGRESEPLFRVIGRWAVRSPRFTPAPMSVASVVLSMRTMFSAERARNLRANIGFDFAGEQFLARVRPGSFYIDVGDAKQSEACFAGDQNALAALLYGGGLLAEMEAAGSLLVSGNYMLAERYLTLFPLPETAPPGDSPRQPD